MTGAVRLSDGSPLYLKFAEEWLVGGAMCAPQDHALIASLIVEPSDFRDASLGAIWSAICDAPTTMVPDVAHLLLERGLLDEVGGEPRLTELAFSTWAFMYAGLPSLEANAGVVKDWSNRRRLVRAAGETARAVLEGKPITRGVRVRGLKRLVA